MPGGGLDSARLHMSLALLAAIPLLLATLGCGATGKVRNTSQGASSSATTPAAPVVARSGGYVKFDGDEDNDELAHPVATGETDEQLLLRSYGARASASDRRAIATLVKDYYAASAAGDAPRACALLQRSLAAGLAAQAATSAGAAHGTCAGAMSLLLEQQHQRLISEDVPTMTVVEVHVKGTQGLAVLGFRTAPESQIVLQREGGAWKIAALFGTYMP